MAVNKVEVNGETKLDLTQDTVTPENLLSGATAHNAAGERIMCKIRQSERYRRRPRRRRRRRRADRSPPGRAAR